ncbi:hypothetical protein SAMN05216323_11791, partial [Williamwhitmania taraxaci]
GLRLLPVGMAPLGPEIVSLRQGSFMAVFVPVFSYVGFEVRCYDKVLHVVFICPTASE